MCDCKLQAIRDWLLSMNMTKELGIATWGHRRKLKKAIEELKGGKVVVIEETIVTVDEPVEETIVTVDEPFVIHDNQKKNCE